jgi:hypothetical protein
MNIKYLIFIFFLASKQIQNEEEIIDESDLTHFEKETSNSFFFFFAIF